MWYPCRMAGMKWNLRSRLGQNTSLKFRHFIFINSAIEIVFFVLKSTWMNFLRAYIIKLFLVRDLDWCNALLCNTCVLHGKNTWPLCNAWHHAHMNYLNVWCFSWMKSQIKQGSVSEKGLSKLGVRAGLPKSTMSNSQFLVSGHVLRVALINSDSELRSCKEI